MADNWAPVEVAAIVADYFDMLARELRAESYNKSDHNRRLSLQLRNRSKGSVEFKHANISAILIELGYPYIDGYKPRGNYQELLRDEVARRLDLDVALGKAAEDAVDSVEPSPSEIVSLSNLIVDPPTRGRQPSRSYERHGPKRRIPRKGVNYLLREANNAQLGLAGEIFAMEVEHRRLWENGRKDLADRIEHVSQTQGDGLGHDIASFNIDGSPLFIEVKTTNFGAMIPFYATRGEVVFSEERNLEFSLYRVFKFRDDKKLFRLPGSLRNSCLLDPVQYQVSLPWSVIDE